MDAFRLLTKSTKRKLHAGEEKSAHHVPSEGPSARPEVLSVNVKKRKRGLGTPVFSHNNALQSGQSLGAEEGGVGNGHSDSSNAALKQRPDSEVPAALSAMSEDERRRVLASHKIKIVNLTDYRKKSTEVRSSALRPTSKDVQGSRKALKGSCRAFPQPLTSFTSLRTIYGVGRALADNIVEQGYKIPTEVQLGSIPLLLRPRPRINGRDTGPEITPNLLTVAPTGSGKTLAFLIPLIEKLTRQHHDANLTVEQRHVSALIVAPTKELVGQIVNEGRKLTQRTGVRITAMRRGMMLNQNGASARQEDGSSESEGSAGAHVRGYCNIVKSDVLVTTPLLLVNAITSSPSSQQSPLSSVTSLVLDEADVLLDPLFRDQTLALWDACTNPHLHVSFWSATIGSNIEELVISIIEKRESDLQLGDGIPLLRCVVGLKDSAISTISHKLIYAATEPGKLLGLRQLLHPPPAVDGRRTTPPLRPPFLVFTQTIERAIALHSELLYDIPSEAGGSSRIAALHSELSDSKRSDVMARVRKGQIWVLITTDLLSRGVDFRGINGVVNYDIPTTSAAYVHRVGRTGRAGREGGVAVTFYTQEDIKYVKGIANVIAASEKGQVNVGDGGSGIQPWLLGTLPDISKKDKQKLKTRGVEVRRSIKGQDDEKTITAKRKAKIGTKSGYERRLENNRKGAVQGSRRRRRDSDADGGGGGDDDDDDDEWDGIDD